jgi:hypothetical protein
MVEANKTNHTNVLIQSICGPLMSKVKLLMTNSKKNQQLAQNAHLSSLIDLLAE